MTKGRARYALCAALVACAASAVAPGQASALTSDYNCPSKVQAQWCDGRANGSFDGLHSWNYNQGWFTNGGSTTICVHVWKPSTGGELGISCYIGSQISQYLGNVQCACYEAEVVHFNAGGPLNLYGFADADIIFP